jgi:hypothetical protein
MPWLSSVADGSIMRLRRDRARISHLPQPSLMASRLPLVVLLERLCSMLPSMLRPPRSRARSRAAALPTR